jgi:hypothetical protein
MGTSDKSLGDPTIQVFLEIPEISEDIPTTGNQDQVTAEILSTEHPAVEIPTMRRQSKQVPVFNEKFLEWKKSLTKPKPNQIASIIFAEKPETRNSKDTMKSEDATEWKAAIEEEVN